MKTEKKQKPEGVVNLKLMIQNNKTFKSNFEDYLTDD